MTTDTKATSHEHAQRSLPWYANGSLQGAEREALERHLAGCRACRELLREDSLLLGAMGEAGTVDLAPQAGLARVMDRIERRERRRRWVAPFRRLRGAAQGHRPLVFAVAVQSLVIVMLTTVLFAMRREPAASYRTLTSGSAADAVVGTARLRVVFAEDMTLAEMRALLRPLEAQIVDGPGERGIYTLAVRGTVDEALGTLRGNERVRFAERVGEP